MDTFLNDTKEHSSNSNDDDVKVEITPNIEYQLNKFNNNDYFKHKHIPEKALFANEDTIHKLKLFYNTNCDIPLLVYGKKGREWVLKHCNMKEWIKTIKTIII